MLVTLLPLHACCRCHDMREQWLHRSFTLTTLAGRPVHFFSLPSWLQFAFAAARALHWDVLKVGCWILL